METRNCQNCKKDFIIESEDFNFYEKIKVPSPTFCPRCRYIRRMAWRNERVLYKSNCGLCKKNIITMYSLDSPFPVYCRDCWWGDGWDATNYARDFDPTRPFFAQMKELQNVVPRVALFQRNSINSDFSNMVVESKNVYLSASVVKNSENVFYSKSIDSSKDIIDSSNVINGSENLYENLEAQSNYNSQYLLLCRATIDSYYCVDCANCSNCFMSYNLRNKKFCIRNKQYTKEEYLKELEKLNLKSRKSREVLLEEYKGLREKAVYKFGNINKCVNVTGNNLLNVKNGKNCFEIYNAEDVSYCFRALEFKDSMDFGFGGWSELMYETHTGVTKSNNVKFSLAALDQVRNAEYTEFCRNSSDIFGCIGISNKKYAILNKVYTKEEFTELRNKIIQQMSEVPYVDKIGRTYSYGEFFPIELSTFSYNETLSQETEPLTKEEVLKKGYNWKDPVAKNFNITISTSEIPDSIDDVEESILQEALECFHKGKCGHQCGEAFRITDYELKFYKKHGIPLPNLCPNCRHYERISPMPGENLYDRSCMCGNGEHGHEAKCPNTFKTAYSPERQEKIYCESCYNKEVY